jgi:hypothetical protein
MRLRLQNGEDLVVLGKTTRLVLREDELAVADDVELALLPGDVRRLKALALQLGRETRGPLVVAVSGRAVVDLDGHPWSLPAE